VFGRYGGEEFAIVLTETGQRGALEVAEKVRQVIAKTPVVYKNKEINFSASIGVSVLSADHHRYEDLIADADSALYRAKSSGRNQVNIKSQLVKCV